VSGTGSTYTTAEPREALQALHDGPGGGGRNPSVATELPCNRCGGTWSDQWRPCEVPTTRRPCEVPTTRRPCRTDFEGPATTGWRSIVRRDRGIARSRRGTGWKGVRGGLRPSSLSWYRAAMTFSVARDEWHYSPLVPATAVVAASTMVWRRHRGCHCHPRPRRLCDLIYSGRPDRRSRSRGYL